MLHIPKMTELNQMFPDKSMSSVKSAVNQALDDSGLKERLRPGERIAITAGSRGIKNIVLILKTVVDYILSLGGRPFIISAMGSHGGGTISGQLEILKQLGITTDNIGAPVLASDQVSQIATDEGRLFYVNTLTSRFDQIIVVNRIKPHTSFHGTTESGLQKMVAVGLGGSQGASSIHAQGVEKLSSTIAEVADTLLKHLPITLGLAITEDARENTMDIVAVPPEDFSRKELYLLEDARASLPQLPFERLDILIVDEIGKNFSGTGMDTNIIGRIRINGVAEPVRPRIQRIIALNLAAESQGNAYGLGLADFTTQRLVDSVDYKTMYLNALTSNFINRAMIPMTLPDDLSAIQAAIRSLGHQKEENLRIARIRNTLQIERMLVSEAIARELTNNQSINIGSRFRPLEFDNHNNLLPF